MTQSMVPVLPARRGFRSLVLLVVATTVLVLAGIAAPQVAHAAITIDVADQTELQNAANTALSGDTINITADIALTAPITFPTGVIVKGSGPGIDITRQNVAAHHLFIFSPTTVVQDYIVQDLNFDGFTGVGSAIVVDDANENAHSLTLTNVEVENFTAGALSAVYIEKITSKLTVSDSDFLNNESVTGDGGAIGGISLFNAVILIEDSTFDSNEASGSGGAVYLPGDNAFTVTIDHNTFTNNDSGGPLGGGGALMSTGMFTTVTLSDNHFENNSALGAGGGALIFGTLFDITVTGTTFLTNHAYNGDGGGLWASAGQDMKIEDSVFTLNTAGLGGGGAYAAGVTSFGMKRTTFDTNNSNEVGGGLKIGASGFMEFEELTVTGNSADRGGGIGTVTSMGRLTLSTFTGNLAVFGGAIYVESETTDFSIGRSTFDGNQAGAVAPAAAFGAAICVNEALNDSAIRFYNSTFSNNILSPGLGGAGISLAILSVQGDVFMDYSEDTFSEPQGSGFVIFVNGVPAASQFSLDRDTIIADGGVYLGNVVGPAQIYNTILDGDFYDSGSPSLQTSGGTVDTSWSIIDEPATGDYNDLGGNQFGVADALLGPLQDNGGPTFTRLPLAGSSAIDLGDPAPAFAPSFDQRLTPFTRTVNGRIDIGAVEVQAAVLALSGSDFSWPTLYLGLFAVFAGLALVGADRRWAVR